MGRRSIISGLALIAIAVFWLYSGTPGLGSRWNNYHVYILIVVGAALVIWNTPALKNRVL